MSEKFNAIGTNFPNAPVNLPLGVDRLRYSDEKEVSALIGFSFQCLRNWRFLGEECRWLINRGETILTLPLEAWNEPSEC